MSFYGDKERMPGYYNGQDRKRAAEDRSPAFYDGQDRSSAYKRAAEDRSPAFYDGQDWTPVVIRGKATTKAQVTREAVPKVSPQASHMRKLAESEEVGKPKRLSNESKQEMILKRVNNKWTQDQLNQECRFPVNTIREIEAGRLCPSPQQLNVLNRVLKMGLKYQI